jgi:Mrp family chromosome partitioning ATPase
MTAIRQLLSDVDWGELDYLLIDFPLGTSDEALSVLQLLPGIAGVLIVTIPNEVSGQVVEKSVTFARQTKAPVIGIVENMSNLIYPHCGEKIDLFGGSAGRRVASDMGVPFLGSIPLDSRIAKDSDTGTLCMGGSREPRRQGLQGDRRQDRGVCREARGVG